MDLTITVTDAEKLTGLQRAAAAYNSMNPASTKTDAEFLQWTIDNQLAEYARNFTKPNITNLEFLNRFTQAERIAIRTAAQSNPAVGDYLAMQDAATSITLTDALTIEGVNALEAAGLIATGRAAIILAL